MSHTSRLAYLLGEMRREKNGAVADYMRFYGAKYGLNYGVSLATVRAKAQAEVSGDVGQDHRFAHLLYKQEVRELMLAAFWLADSEQITTDEELDFWARGVINSEVAEEAAFALMSRCSVVERWLDVEANELLHYAAVMSLAKRGESLSNSLTDRLISLLGSEQNLLPKGVVALLDSAIRGGAESCDVQSFLDRLPDNGGAKYIRDEISWRLEFR